MPSAEHVLVRWDGDKVVTMTITCRSPRKAEYLADGINEELLYTGEITLVLTRPHGRPRQLDDAKDT